MEKPGPSRVVEQALLHSCAFRDDRTGQETGKQQSDYTPLGALQQIISWFVELWSGKWAMLTQAMPKDDPL